MTEQDAIDRFATIAREFCSWAEGQPNANPADEARVILRLLAELYVAALVLPEGEPPDNEIEDTTHGEWLRIYQRCASLPVDRYHEVFNPLDDSDTEPVTATIGDDLADIHRDLRRGFHRFEQAAKLNAVWEWSFHFRAHWGHHATAALYALHSWWADNYFTSLGDEDSSARSAG